MCYVWTIEARGTQRRAESEPKMSANALCELIAELKKDLAACRPNSQEAWELANRVADAEDDLDDLVDAAAAQDD